MLTKIIQKASPDYIHNSNESYCIRSSAIFYVPPSPTKTKIILSNYWKFKSDIDVFLIVSWRNLSGKLRERKKLIFSEGTVRTLTPPDKLFGSCEIEAYASKDLKFPYSAIMAVYESEESISMVHSYSRIYSNIEVEEQNNISDGHEGCWTIKDNDNINSFAVFHNGSQAAKKQLIKLNITNKYGQIKKLNYEFKNLNPYETIVIKPYDIYPEVIDFLNGEEGSCSVHFNVANAFTRMLIGWQTKNKKELQVTHSNFDFSIQETDLIDSEKNDGYMVMPSIKGKDISTIVYPDRTKGKYLVSVDQVNFLNLPDNLAFLKNKGNLIKFKRIDGQMPSRLVTALKISNLKNTASIPCEMSHGILHPLYAPKRFHWGIWSFKFKSLILITSYKEIYGEINNPEIVIKIYSEKNLNIPQIKLSWDEVSIDGVTSELDIRKYFNKANFDLNEYMYVSLYSNYPGFMMYTTLEKKYSFTLEHSF